MKVLPPSMVSSVEKAYTKIENRIIFFKKIENERRDMHV